TRTPPPPRLPPWPLGPWAGPPPARPNRRRPALRSSCVFHRRVLPASGGRDSRVDFFRSPRARLVLVDGRAGLQDWIDDSPGLFDVVFTGEQRSVAVHGVAKHALVRVHLIGARELRAHHLRDLAACLLPRRDDVRADGDRDV